MKKNLLFSAITLGAASMLLTGFDNTATVEDVLEKYTAAAQAADEFSAQTSLAVDIAITAAAEGDTQNITFKTDGTIDIAMKKDPLLLSADADINVAIPDEDPMAANIQFYWNAAEDGSIDLYAGLKEDSETAWEYMSIPAEQLEQFTAALSQTAIDPSATIGTFTLGEESVEIDGVTCYQLIHTLTYDDIRPIIENALKASDETIDDSTLSMIGVMFTNLVVNTEIDIDAETYLPVKLHLDMDGSDFSMLNTILAFAFSQTDNDGNTVLPEISLNINALYLEAVYDYETPVEITIPEEARQQKEEGSSLDLNELTGEVLDSAA